MYVHTYVSVYVVYEEPTTTDVAFTNHNLVSSSSKGGFFSES